MVKCFEHRWGRIFWFDAFDALDHLPPNKARYANRQQKFLILHLFYGCISVFFFVWLQLTRQNSDSNWNLDGTCLPHLFGLKPCDFYIFFKHVTTFDMEFEWFFPKPPPKKITAHGKVHTHTHNYGIQRHVVNRLRHRSPFRFPTDASGTWGKGLSWRVEALHRYGCHRSIWFASFFGRCWF